jgi:hypothetical protein
MSAQQSRFQRFSFQHTAFGSFEAECVYGVSASSKVRQAQLARHSGISVSHPLRTFSALPQACSPTACAISAQPLNPET